MLKYSGFQYMLIDLANHFGLDKEVFSKRLEWANEHLAVLESLSNKAENQPLYMKAVLAIRKAQKGLPTGHLVGMDSCCSGIQIMSTITGCISGATATGLVDPTVRSDAYALTTKTMNELLHQHGLSVNVSRQHAKEALMTSFYGSKAKPVEIFGENTPQLNAFYEAAVKVAPGAWELLQDLLGSWQPNALAHQWKLPDGYDAKVKVMVKESSRVEVDELDHATFTYEYYVNMPKKKDVSNVANVIHSIDAYVLRSMHRRCNYDRAATFIAYEALREEWVLRTAGHTVQMQQGTGKLAYYIDQYYRSGMVDAVILPFINSSTETQYLSDEHIESLIYVAESMLVSEPFELITIHDEFKCHPNHMNQLRQHYINIFADLADSGILSDILSQIYGEEVSFIREGNNLSDLIRNSEYALS